MVHVVKDPGVAHTWLLMQSCYPRYTTSTVVLPMYQRLGWHHLYHPQVEVRYAQCSAMAYHHL